MANKKYRFKRSNDEAGENSSSKAVVVSVICLFAPVWVPMLWWLIFPFSSNEGLIQLGMILMVCLPFFPFFILEKGKGMYFICLCIAIPFLVAIAFVLGWAVMTDRFGP